MKAKTGVVLQDAGAASDDEYDSDGIARAEATFKTRDREAEEWRLRQLQSGQAADNPNFQVQMSTQHPGHHLLSEFLP